MHKQVSELWAFLSLSCHFDSSRFTLFSCIINIAFFLLLSALLEVLFVRKLCLSVSLSLSHCLILPTTVKLVLPLMGLLYIALLCCGGVNRIHKQNSFCHHRQTDENTLPFPEPPEHPLSLVINPCLLQPPCSISPSIPPTPALLLCPPSLFSPSLSLPSHWFLFPYLFFLCTSSFHLCLLADIQSMLNFTLNQVTAFLPSTLSCSLSIHFTISIASLLTCCCRRSTTPPLTPIAIFLPRLPSVSSFSIFPPPSFTGCHFLKPIRPFPPPPLFISPLPFCPPLFILFLSIAQVLSPSLPFCLLKMSFSSWSSLTRNHCVSHGVGGDGFRGWREGEERMGGGSMQPGRKMKRGGRDVGKREEWERERERASMTEEEWEKGGAGSSGRHQ